MFDGGYVMIGKTDNNIYEKSKKVLTLGKPILFYEDATTSYYIDTISLDGSDNVVLTKGGKTITIANDNTITESGEIQNHLYNYYFYIAYDNINSDICKISVEFTSNKNVDLNRNGLIELLNGNNKGVFSCINTLTDLTDSEKTLIYELSYNSSVKKFIMYTIDDENTMTEDIEFSNFEIINTSYKIQLF